jgi:hypothetical protein
MATTNKWVVPNTIATALSTELNSLANGSYTNASSAIDNETDLYEYLDLELLLASLTPSGSPYCSVYLTKSIDSGTNFEDGGGATAPPGAALICTFDLSTSTGAKRRVMGNLLIPPLQFKLIVLNSSGVSLASSGNTLRYRRHNEQSV